MAWQDDLDTLDHAAWRLQTFTFPGNLAQFSTQNASVANGRHPTGAGHRQSQPGCGADFHQYDIERTPAIVKFFVDGTLLRNWTTHIAQMNLPQTILLTIWASSAGSWAGPPHLNLGPHQRDVDWIKVYSWSG